MQRVTSMSFQQIFRRLSRIVRAERGSGFLNRAPQSDLQYAEELIRQANERDQRDRGVAINDTSSKDEPISAERRAYLDACNRLGVSPDASIAVIAKTWRTEIARNHPDKNAGSERDVAVKASERTRELVEAMEVIRRYHGVSVV